MNFYKGLLYLNGVSVTSNIYSMNDLVNNKLDSVTSNIYSMNKLVNNNLDSVGVFKKIKCNYITSEIFNYLNTTQRCRMSNFNKALQKKLSLKLKDFKSVSTRFKVELDHPVKHLCLVSAKDFILNTDKKLIRIENEGTDKEKKIYKYIYEFSGTKNSRDKIRAFIKTSNIDESYMDENKNECIQENVRLSSVRTYENLFQLFFKCKTLKKIDLSDFNLKGTTSLKSMFEGCSDLEEVKFGNYNGQFEDVTDISFMFSKCEKLDNFKFPNFYTKKSCIADYLFDHCYDLKTIDLSEFNTKNITSMNYMFNYCSKLEVLDLSKFNFDDVKSTASMFSHCCKLEKIYFPKKINNSFTNMEYMFKGCGLTSADLSIFNTSNVTSMKGLFTGCSSLKNLNLADCDFNKVEDMSYMFDWCLSLRVINFERVKCTNVKNIDFMFNKCNNLKSLNMEDFSFDNVCTFKGFLNQCYDLKDFKLSLPTDKLIDILSRSLYPCKNIKFITLGQQLYNIKIEEDNYVMVPVIFKTIKK